MVLERIPAADVQDLDTDFVFLDVFQNSIYGFYVKPWICDLRSKMEVKAFEVEVSTDFWKSVSDRIFSFIEEDTKLAFYSARAGYCFYMFYWLNPEKDINIYFFSLRNLFQVVETV